MHPPPLFLGLSEVGWVGEGKGMGTGPLPEQGEVGRVEGGWWLCPARCQRKNRKNRRGGERGGGSWAKDPVASRDGHRAGRGGEGRGWNWGG